VGGQLEAFGLSSRTVAAKGGHTFTIKALGKLPISYESKYNWMVMEVRGACIEMIGGWRPKQALEFADRRVQCNDDHP
jgi:hypothetical protein